MCNQTQNQQISQVIRFPAMKVPIDNIYTMMLVMTARLNGPIAAIMRSNIM